MTTATQERSLLAQAIWDEDTAAIEELLDQGVDVNAPDEYGATPLILAALDGKLDLAAFLIKKGARVNEKSSEGDTALAAAIRKCDVDMARLLLDNGALTSEWGNDGSTPLIQAIVCKCPGIVSLLLERDVDPEERDEQGRAALQWATNHSDDAEIKKLMTDAVESIRRRAAEKNQVIAGEASRTLATVRQGRLRDHASHRNFKIKP